MEFARRNKSFLSFIVAVFVLLMTYMSINSGLADNSGIDGEIGVPVVPSAGNGRFVDAAFMAPDGKHIYTLREGLLTKFSINPFQKVSSYEIDFKEILSGQNLFKVFITPDEKRLIITNNKKKDITLVDVSAGRIIKRIVIKDEYREVDVGEKKHKALASMMVDAVLNGSKLLLFTNNQILIFDAATLTKKKNVPLDWQPVPGNSQVHNVFNKIIYVGGRAVGLIDVKSYRKRELYTYWNARKTEDCWRVGETYIVFDLYSLENGVMKKFNICGYPVDNGESFVEKRTIELGFGPISTAGHYVVSGYRYTIQNMKTSKKYTIVQYPDGELILFDKSDDKHFVLTSSARKHLKMKNLAGDIVPMNAAAFDKYQITNP